MEYSRKIERLGKPSGLLLGFLSAIVYFIGKKTGVSYHYHFDIKEWKGRQIILLADHSSTENYFYAVKGALPFVKPNIVVGHKHFFKKKLSFILRTLHCIPKYLYAQDFRCSMDIIRTLQAGRSLLLFPEGIQSHSGSNRPINPGTVSLLKNAGLPVMLCKSYGSYLICPIYNEKHRKGRHEYHFELLFSQEDIKNLSEEELGDKLLSRFAYNDFKWNKKQGIEYKYPGGNAKNLENILYLCPYCGAEFMNISQGDELICRACGGRTEINARYELIPKGAALPFADIDEWYKAQRHKVMEEIKNEELSYSFSCTVKTLKTDKPHSDIFETCGRGTVTLSCDGIRYKGSFRSEQKEFFFGIEKIPSLVLFPNDNIEFYYDGILYVFFPDEPLKAVKYTMLIEQWHNLRDSKWDKASKEAFL